MKPKRTDPEAVEADERFNRIAAASLEVFSEFSFRDATTDEIARRARVSKRDIYARFPSKHDILLAVISLVLQTNEDRLIQVVALTQESTSLRDRLEVIGLALINEVLSLATGSLIRIVSSESMGQPQIGVLYFEKWYVRRAELISRLLERYVGHASEHLGAHRSRESSQAAEHFLALVTHLPQMTTSVGMRETWNSKRVQAHVKSGVECFLNAYPRLPNN